MSRIPRCVWPRPPPDAILVLAGRPGFSGPACIPPLNCKGRKGVAEMRRFPRFGVERSQAPPLDWAAFWDFVSKASLILGIVAAIHSLRE
jgi:hypothetical protein